MSGDHWALLWMLRLVGLFVSGLGVAELLRATERARPGRTRLFRDRIPEAVLGAVLLLGGGALLMASY
jgi:hypothetical protein